MGAVRELTYLPNWGACLLTDGIAEQWQLWFDSWHCIAKISCQLCKVQTQGFHLLVPICLPKCAACCEQKPGGLPPTQDILWLLPTNVSMSSMHYSCFPPIKKTLAALPHGKQRLLLATEIYSPMVKELSCRKARRRNGIILIWAINCSGKRTKPC